MPHGCWRAFLHWDITRPMLLSLTTRFLLPWETDLDGKLKIRASVNSCGGIRWYTNENTCAYASPLRQRYSPAVLRSPAPVPQPEECQFRHSAPGVRSGGATEVTPVLAPPDAGPPRN